MVYVNKIPLLPLFLLYIDIDNIAYMKIHEHYDDIPCHFLHIFINVRSSYRLYTYCDYVVTARCDLLELLNLQRVQTPVAR